MRDLAFLGLQELFEVQKPLLRLSDRHFRDLADMETCHLDG